MTQHLMGDSGLLCNGKNIFHSVQLRVFHGMTRRRWNSNCSLPAEPQKVLLKWDLMAFYVDA